MNAREQKRADTIKRAGDFGKANAADFTTPIPPAVTLSPAQTKAATIFDARNAPNTGLITRIAKNAATQQTGEGEFHGGTTSKSVLRDALMLELRGFNRSAISISRETHNPGLMDSFRMPYNLDEEEFAARARAFITAVTPLAANFVELGHEPTFLADLETHIKAYEEADTEQNEGEGTQVGATAGFGPLIGEALDKIKTLDAIMHNFYKSDAVKLGTWKTASHVEWQAKSKLTPPTPAPAPAP